MRKMKQLPDVVGSASTWPNRLGIFCHTMSISRIFDRSWLYSDWPKVVSLSSKESCCTDSKMSDSARTFWVSDQKWSICGPPLWLLSKRTLLEVGRPSHAHMFLCLVCSIDLASDAHEDHHRRINLEGFIVGLVE